jgi:hypothetical protein
LSAAAAALAIGVSAGDVSRETGAFLSASRTSCDSP